MILLGISDSQHDASVCLLKDNKILFATAEERLTRLKNQGGFPHKTINIINESVDVVLIAGWMNPPFFVRLFSRFQKIENEVRYNNKSNSIKTWFSDLAQFTIGISRIKSDSFLKIILQYIIKLTIKKNLPLKLKNLPIYIYDHHLCHAASAHYTSKNEKNITITADYWGDGRSFSIYSFEKNNYKLLFEAGASKSIGFFYSVITKYLGFLPNRHEFKLLGLAAHGNAANVCAVYPLKFDGKKIYYNIPLGYKLPPQFKVLLDKYSKEDVAAWLQSNTENIVLQIINKFIPSASKVNICLSGGLFGNVSVNKKIAELPISKSVWVFPNMGDGGLSIGAAALYLNKDKYTPVVMDNAYLGSSFSDDEIVSILRDEKIPFKKIDDFNQIAKEIANGKVVAVFQGKSEFGPRALGNRTILFDARDKKITQKVNKLLQRSDFMPFAPVVLEEDADELFYIKNRNIDYSYMTFLLDCKDYMKRICPAAVHIDGTARPQIINAKTNSKIYSILKAYKKNTKVPLLINTSFNLHEEPIVDSPIDAIETFYKAKMDYLILEDYLINLSSG